MDDLLEFLNHLAEGLGQAGEHFEQLGQQAAKELAGTKDLSPATLARITDAAKKLCELVTRSIADIDAADQSGGNIQTVIARRALDEALSAALNEVADHSKECIDKLPPGPARSILTNIEDKILARLKGAYRKTLLEEFDEEAKKFDTQRTPLDRAKVRQVLEALHDFQKLVCYFSNKIKDLGPPDIVDCCMTIAGCCYGAAKIVADAAAGAGSLAAPGPHTPHVVATATVSIFSGAKRLIKGVKKLKQLLKW